MRIQGKLPRVFEVVYKENEYILDKIYVSEHDNSVRFYFEDKFLFPPKRYYVYRKLDNSLTINCLTKEKIVKYYL